MDFQQLLQTLDKDKFEQALTDYHVDEREKQEYYAFIDRLIEKEKKVEIGLLNIKLIEDEEFPDINAGVIGGDGVNYAIDFIPWEICLGYEVDEASIEKVGKEEFAFHILYDMSFDGFHDEVREVNIKQITDRIENIESGKTEWKSLDNAEELFDLLKSRKDE